MARPKKEVSPVEKQVETMAKLAFQPSEIASVLGLKEMDLHPYWELIKKNWPNDLDFAILRINRMRRAGDSIPSDLINKTRQTIKAHIADMIMREMGSVEDLIGYPIELLIIHLTQKFKPGMDWDQNRKAWHIDHIKPRSLFTTKQIKECFSLQNLQPLWAHENYRKRNKWLQK